MKHIFGYILLAAIIIVCVFQCDGESKSGQIKLKHVQAEAKQLEDSLRTENAELDKIVAANKAKVDSLNHIIEVLKGERETIIIKRDEKIKYVDSYDVRKLQQYFADNYPRE